MIPETRQKYNEKLKIKGSKFTKDNEKLEEKRFVVQSMALNKLMYENFFSAVEQNKPTSREGIKKILMEKPVPKDPWNFELYMPSPLREQDEDIFDEIQREEEKKKQQEQIEKIVKMYLEMKKTEKKISKEELEEFDPLNKNNCLITAMNGGEEASEEDVTMIRYLIYENEGTPYGEYLQASPQVIHTIAMVLEINDITLIIENDDWDMQQFVIADNGNVIEVEGDEREFNMPESKLTLEHTGGNHFVFRRLLKKKKKQIL